MFSCRLYCMLLFGLYFFVCSAFASFFIFIDILVNCHLLFIVVCSFMNILLVNFYLRWSTVQIKLSCIIVRGVCMLFVVILYA